MRSQGLTFTLRTLIAMTALTILGYGGSGGGAYEQNELEQQDLTRIMQQYVLPPQL